VTNATEIIPGVLFYSFLSTKQKEKVGFLKHNILVLQVSGQFTLETSSQKISMRRGEMLLIRKNQLGQITKTPLPGEDYQTIVISLQEDLVRKIALEEQIEVREKYTGPPNVLIPGNDFLHGYFQSVIPYVRNTEDSITTALGILKVKEGVQLLLHAMPGLKEFLFDFSEPHKIDLEKFMLSNFHFNVPVEKFAQLTGRSLAGFKRDFQKTFGTSPRQWLQEKRLTEARHLIEKKNKKPSAIYLDLGFESLSHFSHSFKKKFGKAPTEWV
jgi:AraC-like DNA-binding protein